MSAGLHGLPAEPGAGWRVMDGTAWPLITGREETGGRRAGTGTPSDRPGGAGASAVQLRVQSLACCNLAG